MIRDVLEDKTVVYIQNYSSGWEALYIDGRIQLQQYRITITDFLQVLVNTGVEMSKHNTVNVSDSADILSTVLYNSNCYPDSIQELIEIVEQTPTIRMESERGFGTYGIVEI